MILFSIFVVPYCLSNLIYNIIYGLVWCINESESRLSMKEIVLDVRCEKAKNKRDKIKLRIEM
jgi:hypothetical protein